MQRESHWDYMGRRMREEKMFQSKETLNEVDILKKEVFELQKSLNLAYIRIKELQFFNELSTESHYYKKECDIQLEFKF
jgi:hypothetical protein